MEPHAINPWDSEDSNRADTVYLSLCSQVVYSGIAIAQTHDMGTLSKNPTVLRSADQKLSRGLLQVADSAASMGIGGLKAEAGSNGLCRKLASNVPSMSSQSFLVEP